MVGATYLQFGVPCGTLYCPRECEYDPYTSYNGQPCSWYEGKTCSSFGGNCYGYPTGQCLYIGTDFGPNPSWNYYKCLFFVKWPAWHDAVVAVTTDYGYSSAIVTLQTTFQLSNLKTNITLQPKSETKMTTDDVLGLQAVSLGEYFIPGGSDDSPPISFDQVSTNYTATPQINGGSCGATYTKFDCNTSSTFEFKSLSTGMTKSYILQTGESNAFPLSSLLPDEYNLSVKRSYGCEMSGYGTSCPQDRPGRMQTTGDEEWYLIRLVENPAGTCQKGCNLGFICCENQCRNSTTGTCVDVKGTGVPQWVPLG